MRFAWSFIQVRALIPNHSKWIHPSFDIWIFIFGILHFFGVTAIRET